jgi:polyisoprenoid-binding protein YceI
MKSILISFLFLAALGAEAETKAKTAATKPVAAPTAALTEITSTPDKGAVEFEATGRPAMVKIKGHGEGPTSKLVLDGKKVSGELSFKMDTLDTGIGMRTEHMKERYLETAKFPTAVLKITDLTLPDAWTSKTAALKDQAFKGKLTLHGVEKEVSGIVNVSNSLSAQADFEIKISDFGVAIPTYLGITVADTIKIHVAVNELTVHEAKP